MPRPEGKFPQQQVDGLECEHPAVNKCIVFFHASRPGITDQCICAKVAKAGTMKDADVQALDLIISEAGLLVQNLTSASSKH